VKDESPLEEEGKRGGTRKRHHGNIVRGSVDYYGKGIDLALKSTENCGGCLLAGRRPFFTERDFPLIKETLIHIPGGGGKLARAPDICGFVYLNGGNKSRGRAPRKP